MAGASSLKKAQRNKKDEWYTQLNDIETELQYYRNHFNGKVVFCNCDDPYESNFFKYFAMNFKELGLKKLIATCYGGSPVAYTELDVSKGNCNAKTKKAYKIEINEVTDENGDGAFDLTDVELLIKNKKNVLTELNGDGDFRSEECIELLDKSDIVVTNPPFSLFRVYIDLLIEHKKKFVIIGRNTVLHALDIFPLIKNNKVWVGMGSNLSLVYRTPYTNEIQSNRNAVRNRGYDPDKGYIIVPGICWLTNLDLEKRHEDLIMFKTYKEELYPKYKNFDAIEIGSVKDIPLDYYGVMGVPDTFLPIHNPEQFEIVGRSGDTDWVLNECDFYIPPTSEEAKKYKEYNKNWRRQNAFLVDENGMPYKIPFSRIFIRRKK